MVFYLAAGVDFKWVGGATGLSYSSGNLYGDNSIKKNFNMDFLSGFWFNYINFTNLFLAASFYYFRSDQWLGSIVNHLYTDAPWFKHVQLAQMWFMYEINPHKITYYLQ